MKKLILPGFLLSQAFFQILLAQNVGINAGGTAPTTPSMLEVLQPVGAADNSIGIYAKHPGNTAGWTHYGLQAIADGTAGLAHIAAYLSASGATNNYALIVPSGGGNVGIGNSAPGAIFDITKANNILANIQTVVGNNAIALSSTYGAGTVYWPGLLWYTTDNNPTKPKAGIWSYGDGSGSKLYLGTSNSYATGITNSAVSIDATGNVNIPVLAASSNVRTDASKNLTTGAINLASSDVSGTLPVGNGGTGATTLTGVLQGNGAGAFTALTGTTNYLARWTGSSPYLGIGVTRDDATSVGINAAPTATERLTVAGVGLNGINATTTNAADGSYGVHGNSIANADGFLGYRLTTTNFGAVSVTNPGGYYTGNGNTPLATISNGNTSALIAASMSPTGGRAGNFSIENPNADGLRVVHNATAGAGTGSGIYTTTNQSGGGCLVGWNFNSSGTGVLGGGNNVASINYFPAGSGAAFTGTRYGLYSDETNENTSGTGYYWGQNYAGSQADGVADGVLSDRYHFGVFGDMWVNSTTGAYRTGGVLGAHEDNNTYNAFGILGYRNSVGTYYSGYGSATAWTTGGGFLANSYVTSKIGSGWYGEIMGGWMRGEVTGFTSCGELYASYNLGNEYTSGVQADIITLDKKRVAAYPVTSATIKVYDDGTAKLTSGKARVNFDEKFSEILSGKIPTVTVTPMGKCNGIFIKSIDQSGFDVEEQNNGNSNVHFSYIIVGKRIDADNHDLPIDLQAKDFDAKLKGVMFNEADTIHNAQPMWWDGTKIRFDNMPDTEIDFVKPKKTLSKIPLKLNDERDIFDR